MPNYQTFKVNLYLAAPVIFLLSLPIQHTVFIRLTSLTISLAIALRFWYKSEHPALPLKLSWALYAGIAIASLIWTADIQMTIKEIRNEMVYTFATFFIFFVLANSQRNLFIFMYTLLLGICTQLVMGIYLSLSETAKFNWPYYNVHVYMPFLFPFLLFTIVFSKDIVQRYLLTLILIFIFIGSVATMNRTVWFAIAFEIIIIGILVIAHNQSTVKKRTVFIICSVIIALLTLIPLTLVLEKRYNTQSVQNIVEIIKSDERPDLWKSIYEKASSTHPLIGAGFGRHILFKAYPELKLDGLRWHAHNIFLDVFMQTGLIGLLIFIFLLLSLLKIFWKIYKSENISIAMLGGCGIVLLVGLLVRNMTNYLFYREISLMFWSLTGMTLGIGLRSQLGKNKSYNSTE